MRKITLPIDDETVRSLKVGEPATLSGVMVTGRDAAHKWLIETFIHQTRAPLPEERKIHDELKKLLDGSVIYHCGPVVSGLETKEYRFVAAGPTTSIREEPYQADVMKYFNLKGVVGKGGMGPKTLKGCQETPAVYFHAIGGAASLIAQCVTRVAGVYQLEFGVPEAMWVIEVQDFPVVVTMDSHGESLHAVIEENSRRLLNELLAKPY